MEKGGGVDNVKTFRHYFEAFPKQSSSPSWLLIVICSWYFLGLLIEINCYIWAFILSRCKVWINWPVRWYVSFGIALRCVFLSHLIYKKLGKLLAPVIVPTMTSICFQRFLIWHYTITQTFPYSVYLQPKINRFRLDYTVRKNPSYYRNKWYQKCTSEADPFVTSLGTLL